MASLLDAHPHMVVANEKNLFYRLRNGGKFERNQMFDMLIQGSKGFLRGGKGIVMNGTLKNTTHFGFWMEGYWQGSYDKYINVSTELLTLGNRSTVGFVREQWNADFLALDGENSIHIH